MLPYEVLYNYVPPILSLTNLFSMTNSKLGLPVVRYATMARITCLANAFSSQIYKSMSSFCLCFIPFVFHLENISRLTTVPICLCSFKPNGSQQSFEFNFKFARISQLSSLGKAAKYT